MHTDRFDALLAALALAPSRRATLRLLGGLGLAGIFSPARAKKPHKKKKCAKAGQTTSKRRKKCCAGLGKDGSGRCAPSCVPRGCLVNACGSHPNGCGGALNCGGCPVDQICLQSGVCQPCTVICPAGATDCAAALETTLAGGGIVYVCPGLYQGDILLADSVTVIGAGQGNDPASNTILHGTGTRSVVIIESPAVVNATLQNLRITGGGGGPGGGIRNGAGNILTLVGCTITDNKAESVSGAGGGIFNYTGARLTLTGCTISANTGENSGGGIYNFNGRVTLTNTIVAGNTALAGTNGGGIYTDGGTVTLDAASRVTGNGAKPAPPASGGGIFNSSQFIGGGTVALASPANVTDNTPDNCNGESVPLCVD